MMGPSKDQEVLAAVLESIDAETVPAKEQRALWKAAFEKAKEAYWADFEAKLQSGFGYPLLEDEKKVAFQHAFETLHDTVKANRIKWIERPGDASGLLHDAGLAGMKSICQKAEDAPEDSAIIRELQEATHQEVVLQRVYGRYRDYFLGYARRQFSKASLDTLTDVYQDTWIVLLQYINGQKFRVVKDADGHEWLVGLRNNAHLTTLLTAIGINMLRRNRDNGEDPTTQDPPDMPDDPGDDGGIFSEENHAKLSRALESLSPKCQFLLRCRYWLKQSYREIQKLVDAPSEGALRAQVMRCLESLREKF